MTQYDMPGTIQERMCQSTGGWATLRSALYWRLLSKLRAHAAEMAATLANDARLPFQVP